MAFSRDDWSGFMHITWDIAQHPAEIEKLYEFLLNRKLKTVLEIGTANGGTARLWAELVAPQDGTVYCVDLFNDPAYPGMTWLDEGRKVSKISPNAFKGTPYERFVQEIKGNSHDVEIIAKVRDLCPSIDYLFLDGSHTYQDVLNDFGNYAPLVRPGGVIAFHDILESEYGKRWALEVHLLWAKLADDPRFVERYEYTDSAGTELPTGIGVLVKAG